MSSSTDPTAEPILRAHELVRRLPDDRIVFSQLDLALNVGEIVTVQGPTGAGKTLLLRALAGLDAADAGSVELNGRPIDDWPMPKYRAQALYLHQTPTLFPGSVEDNCRKPFDFKVRKEGRPFNREKAVELLASAGRDDDFLRASTQNLSGGERQIVALTRALLCEPRALLLDEPTAALDPASGQGVERLVTTWLSGRPSAVLWVTHDADQADRVADRQLQLREGRLA